MLEVIGARESRAFRVLWMLEELGADYRHIRARPHSPEVTIHNPAGKIPVLVKDGAALTDSTAIIQFLADQDGRFTHPAGSMERARQDGWTALLLDEFDSCVWAAAKHSFVLPEKWRVKDIKPTLRWEFVRSSERLAARLGGGPYLMGSDMTVPDFILAHCLLWARRAKFDHGRPALEDYFGRLSGRPAFKRAAQL